MTKLCIALLASVLLLDGSLLVAQEAPATTRAVDYGAESYRLVSKPDEIVSVLNNGLTVLVKRVPSPVVAVRRFSIPRPFSRKRWPDTLPAGMRARTGPRTVGTSISAPR